MNLHLHEDEFQELIDATATTLHLPPEAIRKDYFITMILQQLEQSEFKDNVVFKGGTSLSKCYPNSIERFSEDIDLTLIPDLGMTDPMIEKKLKAIEKMLIGVGICEKIPQERNKRNKSCYVWFNDNYREIERIKLEIGSSVRPIHTY